MERQQLRRVAQIDTGLSYLRSGDYSRKTGLWKLEEGQNPWEGDPRYPEVRVLRTTAFSSEGVDMNDYDRAVIDAPDRAEGIDKYRLLPGDVVLTTRSTSVRCGAIPNHEETYVISINLIRIRPDERLNPVLLAAYLSLPATQRQIEAICPSGTDISNITVTGLQRLEVPLIDRDRQEYLAGLVQKRWQLVSQMKRAIDLYRERETAVLHRELVEGKGLKHSGVA